jgi:capsular polysaccharide export protein
LLWCNARVSKYNFASESVRVSQCPYVLVTDQTYGDLSIQYGQADASSFQRMLDAALQENPHCHVLLKIHPDVALGKKKGHFDVQAVAKNPRITLLSDAVHPVRLIEQAESVYCVTSQMGFEALLWGKPVRTFGMPFYAGWGLTQDDLPRPERRKTIALENLVHAALIAYPRYIDPETLQRCEVERLIEWMGLQRQMRGRFPAVVEAAGFSAYKKPIVRRFFQGSTVYFDRKPAKWAEDATQVLWGKKAGFKSVPPAKQKKVIRLEDGFIRSVGLGADLIAPLSWAMDTRGIYYDAGQVSDLEYILQTTVFADGMLERSKNIRTRLLAEGISKYNVGAGTWQRGDAGSKAAGTLILVPGQVETDASIAYGALGLTSNLELLKAVRLANPEAYLIYKPHPDVVAGLRKKGRGETKANDFCDLILNAIDMAHLLEQVDEVHTLTSLTGFEALLRGKKVVCYGLPFYAGWGLTDDKLPLPRRSRTLFLDELVAGALIVYPTYISCSTGKFTTPERALDELLLWRATASTRLPWWRVLLRYFLRLENFVAQSVAALQGK